MASCHQDFAVTNRSKCYAVALLTDLDFIIIIIIIMHNLNAALATASSSRHKPPTFVRRRFSMGGGPCCAFGLGTGARPVHFYAFADDYI